MRMPTFLAAVMGTILLVHAAATAQTKWDDANAAAARAIQEQRYADAEKHLLEAFEEAKHIVETDPRFSFALSQMVAIYSKQGRSAEAELFCHWLEAVAVNNLAELKKNQNALTQAANLHRRSLSIREEFLGKEHIALAESLRNLASTFERDGKFNEAVKCYERLVSIRTKAFGPNHPSVMMAQTSLENAKRGKTADAARKGSGSQTDFLERSEHRHKRQMEADQGRAVGPPGSIR